MDPLLLHIYDATDRSTRLTSWIRRNSWGANVYPVPIEDGLAGLMRALDGEMFLRIGGGETFASTRLGTLYWWNYLNGHIYHIASHPAPSRMKDALGPRLRADVAQRCVNQ
jgi:hypothetical protein